MKQYSFKQKFEITRNFKFKKKSFNQNPTSGQSPIIRGIILCNDQRNSTTQKFTKYKKKIM